MEGFKLFSMKFGPGGNADEQKLAIHELMTKIGKHDILFLQDFPWTTPHDERSWFDILGCNSRLDAVKVKEVQNSNLVMYSAGKFRKNHVEPTINHRSPWDWFNEENRSPAAGTRSQAPRDMDGRYAMCHLEDITQSDRVLLVSWHGPSYGGNNENNFVQYGYLASMLEVVAHTCWSENTSALISGNFNPDFASTPSEVQEWLYNLEGILTNLIDLRESRVKIQFHAPELTSREAVHLAYHNAAHSQDHRTELRGVFEQLAPGECTNYFCTVTIEGITNTLQLNGVTSKHLRMAANFRHGPQVGVLSFGGVPMVIEAAAEPNNNTPAQREDQDRPRQPVYTGTPSTRTGTLPLFRKDIPGSLNKTGESSGLSSNNQVTAEIEESGEGEVLSRRLDLVFERMAPASEVPATEGVDKSSLEERITDTPSSSATITAPDAKMISSRGDSAATLVPLTCEELDKLTVDMLRKVAKVELGPGFRRKYPKKQDLVNALIAHRVTLAALQPEMVEQLERGSATTAAPTTAPEEKQLANMSIVPSKMGPSAAAMASGESIEGPSEPSRKETEGEAAPGSAEVLRYALQTTFSNRINFAFLTTYLSLCGIFVFALAMEQVFEHMHVLLGISYDEPTIFADSSSDGVLTLNKLQQMSHLYSLSAEQNLLLDSKPTNQPCIHRLLATLLNYNKSLGFSARNLLMFLTFYGVMSLLARVFLFLWSTGALRRRPPQEGRSRQNDPARETSCPAMESDSETSRNSHESQ